MSKIEKLGAKLISTITIGGQFGWPPDCYGIYYQPERPVANSKQQRTDNEISVSKDKD